MTLRKWPSPRSREGDREEHGGPEWNQKEEKAATLSHRHLKTLSIKTVKRNELKENVSVSDETRFATERDVLLKRWRVVRPEGPGSCTFATEHVFDETAHTPS